MSRLLAASIVGLACLGWSVNLPFEDIIGFENAWAATGLLGSALAIAAMRRQRRISWPLAIATIAGMGVAFGAWLPTAIAGDPDEMLSSQVGLGSSTIMGLAALVALFRSPPSKKKRDAGSGAE